MMAATLSSGETVKIPKWLWASIGAVAILVAGAMGTWVGRTLIDHESRIGRAEERVDGVKDRIAEANARLQGISDKLDRLLERQR